ncbi:MAG: guanylate kinase [Roseomonas sp.]|nr:guanylate kinase [Roseomonas sp.]MCA3379330.1 guanylate kinase [Roseomonas sp.]
MKRRGLCLVIAAPPGAGKTSVSHALLESEADLTLSVSVTTRAMRPGEQDGVHYHFRDMAEYQAMIVRGDLLEHAIFLGRGYGTPRAPVEAALAEGRDVLFDIEWQGHRQLKASMPADVTSIFLLPPSMAELENRLRKRGQDSDAEIVKRMAAAREEITHWDEFDHVLINQDFDTTVAAARAILHAARSTRARQPGMAEFIKGLLGA